MDDTIYELTDIVYPQCMQRHFLMGFTFGFIIGFPIAITLALVITWLLS